MKGFMIKMSHHFSSSSRVRTYWNLIARVSQWTFRPKMLMTVTGITLTRVLKGL